MQNKYFLDFLMVRKKYNTQLGTFTDLEIHLLQSQNTMQSITLHYAPALAQGPSLAIGFLPSVDSIPAEVASRQPRCHLLLASSLALQTNPEINQSIKKLLQLFSSKKERECEQNLRDSNVPREGNSKKLHRISGHKTVISHLANLVLCLDIIANTHCS